MEQQQDNSGVSRGQNQLHVLPEDASNAAAIVLPLLERVDTNVAAIQALVVTPDAEMAASLAGRIAAHAPGLRTVAATGARRAQRALKAEQPHVLLGPPETLLELLRGAAIKLDAVRALVLAWIDDQGEAGMAALETVLAEVPRDAARIVMAGDITPATEQLVERYARKARRLQTSEPESGEPVALSYVTTASTGRIEALRRTLDLLDPESALVIVPSSDSNVVAQVNDLLHALGYGREGSAIRAGERTDAAEKLVILVGLPANANELRIAATRAGRTVAIVTPRQIPSLRRMAGGRVEPLRLPEAAARARSREDALRDELRAVLSAGNYVRELLTLDPLLHDWDGAEVAAAALRLLDAERLKASAEAPVTERIAAPLTRLYVNIGSMDDVRPGDLIGAITNEAGISRAELGRVDVRERHSTVEVATPVANAVVDKLTGIQMKGRRLLARVDEDRPRRPGARSDRSGRTGAGERPGRGRPIRDRQRPPRRGGGA